MLSTLQTVASCSLCDTRYNILERRLYKPFTSQKNNPIIQGCLISLRRKTPIFQAFCKYFYDYSFSVANRPDLGVKGRDANHSSPHSVMVTAVFGRSLLGSVGTLSILLKISKLCLPNSLPNTTCLPSNQGAGLVRIKNWQPFVFGPVFAQLTRPGSSWIRLKFSSANVVP